MLYTALLVILLVTGNMGGGWKSKLQKTASFIKVKPLNVYQSTHTYILLAASILPKLSRG
jgi:hypothetical protein